MTYWDDNFAERAGDADTVDGKDAEELQGLQLTEVKSGTFPMGGDDNVKKSTGTNAPVMVAWRVYNGDDTSVDMKMNANDDIHWTTLGGSGIDIEYTVYEVV